MITANNKTILIVEDDIIFATSVSKQLTSSGYKIIITSTGEQAIAAISEKKLIHLILMDLDLGNGIDGAETAKKILEMEDLPIIFYTSHNDQKMVERVRSITRYGYVLKNAGEFVLKSSIDIAFELFSAQQIQSDNSLIEATGNEAVNLFHAVVENIPNMIFIKHAKDLKFALINRAGETLLGVNRDDLIGKSDYDFFPKEQADFFTGKDQDVLLKREVFDIPEETIDTPYGKKILHTKKLPLLDEFGNSQYLLGISEDITERKKAERRMKESESQFKNMFESHNAPMLLIEPNSGLILDANKAAIKFYGYSKDVITKMSIDKINTLNPERIFEERQKAVEEKRNYFIFHHRLASGEERIVEVHSSSILFQGEIVLFSIIHDISNRRMAEERIKSLLSEKELLLKEVHHRIKNNMLTITSLLYLQISNLSDPVAIAALNDASSRIQSMMVLYDKLYRSTDFKELSVPEYLSTLVEEIVNNFPNRDLVKIENYIEDFILPTSILFPVGIVINELLTNAMKYAFVNRDSGLISVIAKQDGDDFLFSVKDNGIGIAEDIAMEKSSGFGFQLIKMLAKQLKGSISVNEDNGSEFTLRFRLF